MRQIGYQSCETNLVGTPQKAVGFVAIGGGEHGIAEIVR